MSARVFIHPRCWGGPAFGALAATLETCGLDLTNVMIGPEDKRRRRELVYKRFEANGVVTFERFDGSTFEHINGTAPEAA